MVEGFMDKVNINTDGGHLLQVSCIGFYIRRRLEKDSISFSDFERFCLIFSLGRDPP